MNKWGVGLTFLLAATSVMAKDIQLLNVSYDPTRELYERPESIQQEVIVILFAHSLDHFDVQEDFRQQISFCIPKFRGSHD